MPGGVKSEVEVKTGLFTYVSRSRFGMVIAAMSRVSKHVSRSLFIMTMTVRQCVERTADSQEVQHIYSCIFASVDYFLLMVAMLLLHTPDRQFMMMIVPVGATVDLHSFRGVSISYERSQGEPIISEYCFCK